MNLEPQLIIKLRSDLLKLIEALPYAMPQKLPRMSGVYFVFDRDELVYIGKALDLYKRWCSHRFKSEVSSGLFRLKWKQCDTSEFCSAEHEEAFFIVSLRPKFNELVRTRVFPC